MKDGVCMVDEGNIKCADDRDDALVAQLVSIWESSVRATHLFLTEEEILSIKPEVPVALSNVEYLYLYYEGEGRPLGFIGVESGKIEILFIGDSVRRKGIGGKLIKYVIENLSAVKVDVNEQNGQGIGFYEHQGFSIVGRSELDDQGRPFPLLHMEYVG